MQLYNSYIAVHHVYYKVYQGQAQHEVTLFILSALSETNTLCERQDIVLSVQAAILKYTEYLKYNEPGYWQLGLAIGHYLVIFWHIVHFLFSVFG